MAGTAKSTKKAPAVVEQVIEVQAFKGFDKNLVCNPNGVPFQYEVSKTFEHTGDVVACSTGFHACENPWDVLGYYPLIDAEGSFNRFCRVTLSGQIARHGSDSKVAGGRIAVDVELKLPEFISAGIKWLIDATKPGAVKATGALSDKGEDDARIGSSGYGARIGSSGNGAQIGGSGYGAQIGSSGNDAQIGSSGYGARIGSSGYGAQIGSSGNGAQIGSSGNGAQIGSSGNGAQIGSSGYDARIGSSGYGARIGSSGNGAQIGSSGNGAQIGSSGNGAQIGSSGNGAQIGSSGYGAQIDASGERAVVASAGVEARAKGAAGTWLSLAEYEYNRSESRWHCIGFATGKAGHDGVPADTWLIAKGGKLVAA